MKEDDYIIEFAPSFFDDFEGSQEDLDEIIATVRAAIQSGDIFKDAVDVGGFLDDFEDEYDLKDFQFPKKSIH